MFRDRTDAGKQLAGALAAYKGQPVVVYGLPRGGVVLAAEVARSLDAPMDLVIVRKIGHPLQPEYAVGAVDENGHVVINPDAESLDREWFEHAAAVGLKEAWRRRALYLEGRGPIPVKDKIAIIVDDGLATGLTMRAAIHDVQRRGPKKVIVAVPIAAADVVKELRPAVDDVVVLVIPKGWFGAIGGFYQHFDQVSDEEVVELVKRAADSVAH